MGDHEDDVPLSIGDFAQIRPWMAANAQDQHHPSAYRQSKHLPDLVDGDIELSRFERLIRRKDHDSGNLPPMFTWARIISRALHELDYLETMADNRNRTLPASRQPIPQRLYASNWEQVMMRRHVQNLIDDMFAGGQYQVVPGYRHLQGSNIMFALESLQYMRSADDMDAISRLEFVQRHRLRQNTGGLREEFQWLKPFRHSLEDARNTIFAAWTWSRQEYATAEVVLDKCLQDIPEMTRLLALLLEREKSFEDLNAQEHIFGIDFDKRIQLFDPRDISKTWYGFMFNNDSANWERSLVAIYHDLHSLYRQLTDQALRLNQLFDYRYMWAWNAIKMWDKLFVIIRPEMQISDETIDKFNDWVRNSGMIAENVFGVHPISEQEIKGEDCAICFDKFVENDHLHGVVVLRTKCGHWFHPKCIIECWDVPGFWWNRCPLCRQSALHIRDIAGLNLYQEDQEHELGDNQRLDAERHDNVVDIMNLRGNITHFDVDTQNAYWRPEIREHFLRPMRAEREAVRNSWESVLGGSV